MRDNEIFCRLRMCLYGVILVDDSPKQNHTFHEVKLPPKKAVVQNLNGLIKSVLPKSTAPPTPPIPVSAENAKKIPLFPITVSLQGQVPNSPFTLLSSIPQAGNLDLAMAGKLMEIQQKVRPPVTQILHQTLTQRQALQKKTNSSVSIGLCAMFSQFNLCSI